VNATTSRRLAAVAVLLAVPALSACGVNFSAQTDQQYTPADGVNSREGVVDVLNALVVSDADGTGRFIAGFTSNTDVDQTITGIAGVGDDQGTGVELGDGDFTVPARGFLQLADDESTMVAVTGEPVVAGYYVRLVINFSDASPVELDVPVVDVGTDFEELPLPEDVTLEGSG